MPTDMRDTPRHCKADTVKFLSRLLVDLREKMPVSVIGERDRVVTRSPSDFRGVDPGKGKERDAGVLQIVRAQGANTSCPNSSLPSTRAPVVCKKRRSPLGPNT